MLKLLLVRRGKLAAENVDVPFRVTRAVAAPRRRRVYRVNFRPRRHPTTLPTSSRRRRRRHKLIHIVKHARFRRRLHRRPLFLALLFLARTFAAKKIRRILRDTRRERAARSPWFRSSAILLYSYLSFLLVFEFQLSQDPLDVVLFVLLFTSAFFLVQIQFSFPFRFRHAGEFRLGHFPELLVVFFTLVPAAAHSYRVLLLRFSKTSRSKRFVKCVASFHFSPREKEETNNLGLHFN